MITWLGLTWFIGALFTFGMGIEEAITEGDTPWMIALGAVLCALAWPFFLGVSFKLWMKGGS